MPFTFTLLLGASLAPIPSPFCASVWPPMPTLLLTDSSALLASFAPSLFGGAPRFVARRQPVRGRLYGNGVRFSDEGDIDFARLCCRSEEALEDVRQGGSSRALSQIVARHLVATSAHRSTAFSPRPPNAELARRLAAHLATDTERPVGEGDESRAHVDTFVSPSSLGPFGDAVATELLDDEGVRQDLVATIGAFAPGSVVVTSRFAAEVVRKDGATDGGPLSQAASFATGLAPAILHQVAAFAGATEALQDAFDDVALAIALGRVEDRVYRALRTNTPCVLGGPKAPLFVAPDATHFALPASLQAALDQAEQQGVALSPNLQSLLSARRQQQARLLRLAQDLAAFETELRLPPLDDPTAWFKKSGLLRALAGAQDAQAHDAQEEPLWVLGRDPSLFDHAGREGIRLRPLSHKWLRPLLEQRGEAARLAVASVAATSPGAEEETPGESQSSVLSPAPPPVAPSPPVVTPAASSPIAAVAPRSPVATPSASSPAVAPSSPVVTHAASSPQSAPAPAPVVSSPVGSSPPVSPVPASVAPASATTESKRADVEPSNGDELALPSPLPAAAMRPLPSPSTGLALPLFRDPHRAPVDVGFDFSSLKITVDDVEIVEAKDRVGRLHQGLAASVPEARAGALVWVEGDLSLASFDDQPQAATAWPQWQALASGEDA